MTYDLLIIGGGPTGLACGLEAQKAGLQYLILEKGALAVHRVEAFGFGAR